jgi:hypothetical protein
LGFPLLVGIVNKVTAMLQIRIGRFDAPSGASILRAYPSVFPNVDVFAIPNQPVAPFF